MRKLHCLLFLLFTNLVAFAAVNPGVAVQDTNEVRHLNRLAYNNYRDNARQTIAYANEALAMATQLGYMNGIAEANRMIGIANSSLNDDTEAIRYYLIALDDYKLSHNLSGQLRVYNNFGNLYQQVDYDKALEFFDKALSISNKLKDTRFQSAINLNIGNVYYRKNKFTLAMNYYQQSEKMFRMLNDTINLIVCWQNMGVMSFNIKNYAEAKRLLTYANREAKLHDLNKTTAEIDLTLASVYIAENDFANAKLTLDEGKNYADLVKSDKLKYDLLFTAYELESKQQDYKAALEDLRLIYKRDSILFRTSNSTKLNLLQEQYRVREQQIETKHQLQLQSYNRYKFIAATIVAGLLLVVILMLIGNVKRKTETNKRLTDLNAEINYQKDNLDKINHHLEEIIDERTKDLQDKNTRLSEYSSYLSHQIRGPIATLKGLLNLEKESLLSQQECLDMMDKCVSDIDEKIIGVSEMLHDSETEAAKTTMM